MKYTYKKNKKQKSNSGIIFLFFFLVLGGVAIFFYFQSKNKTLEKLNSTIQEYINLEKAIQQQNKYIKNQIKGDLTQLINEINQYETPNSNRFRNFKKLNDTFKKIILLTKELKSQGININVSVQTPTITDLMLLKNDLEKIKNNITTGKYDKKYHFADEDGNIVSFGTEKTDISIVNNSFISTNLENNRNNNKSEKTNINLDNNKDNNIKNTKDNLNNKTNLQILNQINDLGLSDKQIEILKKLSNQ